MPRPSPSGASASAAPEQVLQELTEMISRYILEESH